MCTNTSGSCCRQGEGSPGCAPHALLIWQRLKQPMQGLGTMLGGGASWILAAGDRAWRQGCCCRVLPLRGRTVGIWEPNAAGHSLYPDPSQGLGAELPPSPAPACSGARPPLCWHLRGEAHPPSGRREWGSRFSPWARQPLPPDAVWGLGNSVPFDSQEFSDEPPPTKSTTGSPNLQPLAQPLPPRSTQ